MPVNWIGLGPSSRSWTRASPRRRLMTITGVNATVAMSVLAAIGDIKRFSSPQKLVSYFGLNPKV
ncbi:transposase, partial [Microvirga lotononidis]|uniref:transposase n=1 Tax=Microvirga lotononidis TaxID=864069 RepID=UPI003CC918B6